MDHRCQSRADVNHDAVAEYAEAYKAGADLPPPQVFLVSGKLYVVDGYHRVPAAIAAGLGFLRVEIVGEGTIDDAIWYATGVNQSHGVRRSNADKRRAIWMALDGIGQEQSSRAIAAHCGVSVELVTKVRQEWEAKQVIDRSPVRRGCQVIDRSPEPAEQPERKRRGKDGKLYPAKPRVAEPAPLDPEPPVTDEAALPFEPVTTATPMPGYGPALLEAAKRVREVRIGALRSVPEHPSLVGVRQRFEKSMREAQAALELAEPIAHGSCGGAGCVRCGRAGWLAKGTATR